MIIFRILSQPEGWYVATDAARTGPFWSRVQAIELAEGMIKALRQHGDGAVLDAGEGGAKGPADPPRATEAIVA